MKEKELQKFCDDYIKLKKLKCLRIPDGVFYLLRQTNKYFYTKALSGFPDNIVLIKSQYDGICYALMLENKAPKGKLRSNQEDWWCVCRTPEEVKQAIDNFIDFVDKIKQK
jgi:hypothetical protein